MQVQPGAEVTGGETRDRPGQVPQGGKDGTRERQRKEKTHDKKRSDEQEQIGRFPGISRLQFKPRAACAHHAVHAAVHNDGNRDVNRPSPHGAGQAGRNACLTLQGGGHLRALGMVLHFCRVFLGIGQNDAPGVDQGDPLMRLVSHPVCQRIELSAPAPDHQGHRGPPRRERTLLQPVHHGIERHPAHHAE